MKAISISSVALIFAIYSASSSSSSSGVSESNARRRAAEWTELDALLQTTETLCPYNEDKVPIEIYQILVGWQCYERVYQQQKLLVAHLCPVKSHQGEIYKVPCFKTEEKVLSFDLQFEDTLLHITVLHGNISVSKILECYWSEITICTESQQVPAPRDVPQIDPQVPHVEDCTGDDRIQFYLAFLSISLILGVPAAIFLTYCSLMMSSSKLLSYHRNTLSAVICRTFFTMLIITEVISPGGSSPLAMNGPGCKALAFFEVLSMNMFLTFWFATSMYLHLHVKEGLDKEPSVRRSNYTIAGTAVVASLVWVIVTAATHDTDCWVGGERSWIQWLRVGILVLQIMLLGNILRVLFTQMKAVHDDTAMRMRRVAVVTLFLTLVFVIQFCLNSSAPQYPTCNDAHIYSMYFFDGVQGTLIALLFCYFDPDVIAAAKVVLGLDLRKTPESEPRGDGNTERHISTIDSIVAREGRNSRPRQDVEGTQHMQDVRYSSVVRPEQFHKTIELINRLNVAPQASISLVDGDAYVDCNTPAVDRKISLISEYYDADSVNDFHDPLASQTSLNIFHEVELSTHHVDRSALKQVDRVQPLPLLTQVKEVQEAAPSQAPKSHTKTPYESKYLVEDSDTISTISESSVTEGSPVEYEADTRDSFNSEYSTTSSLEPPQLRRQLEAPKIIFTEEPLDRDTVITVPQVPPRRTKERLLVEQLIETTAEDMPKEFVVKRTEEGETVRDSEATADRRSSESGSSSSDTDTEVIARPVLVLHHVPLTGKEQSIDSTADSDTDIEEDNILENSEIHQAKPIRKAGLYSYSQTSAKPQTHGIVQPQIIVDEKDVLKHPTDETPQQNIIELFPNERDKQVGVKGYPKREEETYEDKKEQYKEDERDGSEERKDSYAERDKRRLVEITKNTDSPSETTDSENETDHRLKYTSTDQDKTDDVPKNRNNPFSERIIDHQYDEKNCSDSEFDTEKRRKHDEKDFQNEINKLVADSGSESSAESTNAKKTVDDYYSNLYNTIKKDEVKQCVPVKLDTDSEDETSQREVAEEVEASVRPTAITTALPSIYDDLRINRPRRPNSSNEDKKTVYSNMWSKYRNKIISDKKDGADGTQSWPGRSQTAPKTQFQMEETEQTAKDIFSDTCSESEDEVGKAVHKPTPVQQQNTNWEPQTIHYS